MMSWRAWVCAAAIAVGVAGASADEVLFNNGDRLTGKVVSVEGGKLKIKTTVAGEVTVDLANVKTFSTDEPIELLVDGKTLRAKVSKGADGTVQLAGAKPLSCGQ